MRSRAEEMQDFEGPLDLILYLLSKNKMEIQDISISLLCDQYISWLEQRQRMDLEVASEFVAMASHLVYIKTRSILGALIGEVLGTAILGGLCAYPIAILFMGQSASDLAFYAYIIPFLISTAAGAIISAVLIYSMKKSKALQSMQESLNR